MGTNTIQPKILGCFSLGICSDFAVVGVIDSSEDGFKRTNVLHVDSVTPYYLGRLDLIINGLKIYCRTPLHEDCLKHHGYKGDPGVIPRTCSAVGARAQVILVWVRALGVGNASHPQRLGGMRVRP